MPLDPDAQLVLEMIRVAGRPPFETLTPAEAREAYVNSRRVLQPPPEDVAEVRDLSAPGPASDIPVRVYRARGTTPAEKLPALIYYHGGGWLLGDLDFARWCVPAFCQCGTLLRGVGGLPHGTGTQIPRGGGRLRSCHKMGGGSGRCAGHRPGTRGRRRRFCGGNLAAVMALLARDGVLPPLTFQLLIYPATDMMMTSVSSQTITEGVPLTSKTMRWFIDHYMRDGADERDWRASPLRAADLSGTAHALVLTCACDPLCDEGIAYARRLERKACG